MPEEQKLQEPRREHPPALLYDDDGTVVAALGTLDKVMITCCLRIGDEQVQREVPASELPHPFEIINEFGYAERTIGKARVAWTCARDKAAEELWWRVRPKASEQCDACEMVLTAEMIEESGDFEQCERLPRESWFEYLSPCPYNKWGATPIGVTYVVFPDR